jgi:lipid A disaccharide synthetase
LVREFIQDAAKPRAIADELLWLLNDEVYAKRMIAGFEELRDMLGVHTGLAAEPVSLRAAREIAECL